MSHTKTPKIETDNMSAIDMLKLCASDIERNVVRIDGEIAALIAENEKLKQGIKDAIEEMEARAEANASERFNQHCQSLANAYERSAEILTDKTNIQ